VIRVFFDNGWEELERRAWEKLKKGEITEEQFSEFCKKRALSDY